jgi:hypothetical protein
MTFINPVWFKADLPITAVMEFIARTPAECYYLVPAGGGFYYGMLLEEDMLEYLTNEFLVRSLQIAPSAEVKKCWNNLGARSGAAFPTVLPGSM